MKNHATTPTTTPIFTKKFAKKSHYDRLKDQAPCKLHGAFIVYKKILLNQMTDNLLVHDSINTKRAKTDFVTALNLDCAIEKIWHNDNVFSITIDFFIISGYNNIEKTRKTTTNFQ